MEKTDEALYRMLPQVGEVLERAEIAGMAERHSREQLAEATRSVLARTRQELQAGLHTKSSLEAQLGGLPQTVAQELAQGSQLSLRRVINATGVILQTNLGRAPLSRAALEHIAETAGGYCNLEFDVDTGERSRRDLHAESLLLQVLAQRSGIPAAGLQQRRAATVVNNCAAATLLALNTLAEGGEVIVSRGELVEIGGGFRIPEILRKSGAVLREVGTTNRTRLADYAAAIGDKTRLILRVHRSNFRIEGFTEQPALEDLIELGQRTSIPIFDDQGTGCVIDLGSHGIPHEASWVKSAAGRAALVAASGDKLLGGPQCGLLVGDGEVIAHVRANPLFRALRVDKLTFAALEATLLSYLERREQTLPAIAMIRLSPELLRERSERYAEALRSADYAVEVVPCSSIIGGGTTPGAMLPGTAVALQHTSLSEGVLAARLRGLRPAILARTHHGRVLLDLRTVPAEEDELVIRLLRQALTVA